MKLPIVHVACTPLYNATVHCLSNYICRLQLCNSAAYIGSCKLAVAPLVLQLAVEKGGRVGGQYTQPPDSINSPYPAISWTAGPTDIVLTVSSTDSVHDISHSLPGLTLCRDTSLQDIARTVSYRPRVLQTQSHSHSVSVSF